MKHRNAFLPFIASLFILTGAGCGTPVPASPIAVQPIQPAQTATPTPPPAMTDTQPASSTEALAFPGILSDEQVTDKIVRITTDAGEITFELLPQEGPKAASNFVYLATKKFYDGLIFHRVESWVIQGGDPTGTGMGGPGYRFEEEPARLPYSKGIVAMAKTPQPNTNGSQFFIMKQDMALDPVYSIFGRVLSGQDVVDKITVGTKMLSVTVEDRK